MKRLLRSSLAHYLSWAAVLVIALVARPAPGSPSFILLFGAAVVLGALLMLRSYLESREARRAFEMWQMRLSKLVPTIDVDDDGHLYERLDPSQWEAVFAMLEQTPQDSRSLRQAMEAVAPEITK
jgi:hypothetical protein